MVMYGLCVIVKQANNEIPIQVQLKIEMNHDWDVNFAFYLAADFRKRWNSIYI